MRLTEDTFFLVLRVCDVDKESEMSEEEELDEQQWHAICNSLNTFEQSLRFTRDI